MSYITDGKKELKRSEKISIGGEKPSLGGGGGGVCCGSVGERGCVVGGGVWGGRWRGGGGVFGVRALWGCVVWGGWGVRWLRGRRGGGGGSKRVVRCGV